MATENLPNYLTAAKPNPMDNRAVVQKHRTVVCGYLYIRAVYGRDGRFAGLWQCLGDSNRFGRRIAVLFCTVLRSGQVGIDDWFATLRGGQFDLWCQGRHCHAGLLMGILQIGWHAVFTITAAKFLVQALGVDAAVGSVMFWVICAIWGMVFAFVGATGIGLLGTLSTYLPVLPLLAIIIAGLTNMSGISKFSGTSAVMPESVPVFGLAIFAALQAAAGFFATAGAAGADFTMNSRNEKDVVMGGFIGVTIVAIVAGFFAILAMAGAMGNDIDAVSNAGKGDMFIGSIAQVGSLSGIMFWVFVIACICPTGFCAFLAANSFSTMFPKLPRVGMTMAAGAVGVILAATGFADNLVGFFLIIGASFGPIIGAMVADYLRNGKWTGPRKGINWAGYIAWGLGFLVGILYLFNSKWGYGLETLMSFIVGFSVYLIAAEMGLEPPTVELEKK